MTRPITSLFQRPAANLASAPSYVRRGGAGGASFSSLVRSDRTSHLEAYGAHGTLYQIVTKTAFTVSTAEWQLFRSAKSGRTDDREQVTSHAALDLLNRPNEFYTRQELLEALGQHFELCGELWMVVVKSGALPVELWPVRPDRMQPQPSAEKFLAGYWYLDPDGDKIPLDIDEVLFLKQPSPLDPYRGTGPVGTILRDVYGSAAAKDYNVAFFDNNAEPGGVLEAPERLSDEEWQEMRQRWADAHRGTSNAHRVAIVEGGVKYVQMNGTRKDMQFLEGLEFSGEEIRKAFGYPKPMLGSVDDVNRANADAGETVFARWLVKTRLERLRGLLNSRYLRLFGSLGKGLEFDFVNPVPEDIELDNATRDSKISAARTLVVDLHATRESVVEALGLPASLEFEEIPEPVPPQLPPGDDEPPSNVIRVPSSVVPVQAYHDVLDVERQLALPWLAQTDTATGIDLSDLQADWERELDALLMRWRDVTAQQRRELRDQIKVAIETEDVEMLAALTADATVGADVLALAMAAMHRAGAGAVVAEASAQGETIETVPPDEDVLGQLAAAAALLLALGLAQSAGAEALRRYSTGADADAIATGVDEHLESLSDAHLRERLGGMLTQAQNAGRVETLRGAPTAKYYASETLDRNTCKPCRAIDGQRLPTLDAAMLAYGGSGYLFCDGTWRCRGTVVAVWGDDE